MQPVNFIFMYFCTCVYGRACVCAHVCMEQPGAFYTYVILQIQR